MISACRRMICVVAGRFFIRFTRLTDWTDSVELCFGQSITPYRRSPASPKPGTM